MSNAARQTKRELGHQVPVERLLKLFDALHAVEGGSWVTLFEKDAPGAEYAARLWASTKDMTIQVRPIEHDDGTVLGEVVHILQGFRSFISIHRADEVQS